MTISMFSCSQKADSEENSKDGSKAEDTTIDGVEVEPEVFDGVSNIRFTDAQLLTFFHKDGKTVLESGYMAQFTEDGNVKITTFDSDKGEEYTEAKAPLEVAVGDSAEDFIKKYSIDPGFGIFVDNTGANHNFTEGKTATVPNGGQGYIYLGLGKDGDKWAYMDHEFLKSVIMGKAMVMGADSFPAVLFSCILDENENIIQMYQFYGELSNVMAYIAG